MKILVYVGYQNTNITPQRIESCDGVGGTEIAALKLAEGLAKRGHAVCFGGQVESTFHNGVTWLNIDQCHQQHFDLLIAASYLHYLKEFNNFDKSLFWFHNTDWFPWWRGEAVIDSSWLEDPRITGFIALTEWHKQQLIRDYSLQKPIHVIGNGIDRNDFPSWKVEKIPNSFIYSSARERGLYDLLKMWPRIHQNLIGATLRVFGPGYDIDNSPLPQLDGVTYMGTVDQMTLHNWQMKSEYWLHPTHYEETYGITALEAQYCGAIPITTNLAALSEVVGNRGFLLESGETDTDILNIIKVLHGSPEVKAKLRRRAHEWAKQQTWNFRVEQWLHIINTI